MPDASSFIAQRLAGAVVGGRTFAKTHSTMASIQKKLQRHGDAYPRIPRTTIDVYVQGTLKYTSGVYAPGGDYSLIKQAIADAYGVNVAEVELTVLPGSINIDYRLIGIPTKDPPPQGIVAALTTLIQTYGGKILKLTFENDNTACTYTVTVDASLVPSNLYYGNGASASAISGYIDVNSLAINYTTPGIYKYTIPAGYSSMTVILAGGGSAGTPSLALMDGNRLYGVKHGVNGSSGGLLIFKVITANYVGKELTINVGAGGVGYSFDVSKDFYAYRMAMGSPGQASSIEIDGKIIAITQGGNSNYMDASIADINITQLSYYSFGDAAINSLYIPTSITSDGLASNGGSEGPPTLNLSVVYPFAQPLWWPKNNVGNIGDHPSMYHGFPKNNGGNGYFGLLFDRITTSITESPPPPSLNNPADLSYIYTRRGDYVMPVPRHYKTARITVAGGRGGDGYVGNLTSMLDGRGQNYYISFVIPTKLLGEKINCKVGAGGLGGRAYTLVNGVKNKITPITGGPGENTVLTTSNGFAITAGGGKDNVCNLTYPVIPESDEGFDQNGEAGHGVEARAGYTGLKYKIEDGIVTELYLNFYINSKKTGTALVDFATDPLIQVFRGDGTLILSDASTGYKRMIINSNTFRMSVSGVATNNWKMDKAIARKSWTYTIGTAVCNPRRNPNTIYKTAGDPGVRYNRIDELTVYSSNSFDDGYNQGWTPGIDSDSLNLEFGYNGSDGEFGITFSDYTPVVSNPPKLVISGNHQSISARYFDNNNNDITSTIDNNRKLWIYSNDPEFGKKLTTTTSTDNYAYGSEFSLKSPSKITYFMYDSYYDVRSNYLDVDIPVSTSIRVTNVQLQEIGAYGSNGGTRTYKYGYEIDNKTPWSTTYTFSILIVPVNNYGNIIKSPGVSALVRCDYDYATTVNATQTIVGRSNSQTLDLTNGPVNYYVVLTDGSQALGAIGNLNLTVTINNITYSYPMLAPEPGSKRLKSGGPFQPPSTASPIFDQFIQYTADTPPPTTTTTTTKRNTFTSYITSMIVQGSANPAQLAIDPSDVLYITNSGIPNGWINRFDTKTNSMVSDASITARGTSNIYGVAVNSALEIFYTDRTNSFVESSNRTLTLGTPRITSGPIPGYMNNPTGITVDVTGHVYVANTGDNNIIKIAPSNKNEIIVSGLNAPVGIAVDVYSNVYVADTDNNLVKKYNNNGIIMLTIPGFNQPKGVVVDTSGNIYVADTGNNLVKKYNENGVIMATISGFNQPYGIAVDTVGNVYVSNYGDGKILKLTPQ